MRETEDNTSKWKDIQVLKTTIKVLFLPKLNYGVHVIPIKIPTDCFLKSQIKTKIWKILRELDNYHSLISRLAYYKAIVVKTAWYWYQDRPVGHWKRIESLEIGPHISSQGNSVGKE